MKNLFFLVVLFLFFSCISINENGYQYLRFADKAYVHPFEEAKFQNPGDNKNCFKLFEVNTSNIKSIINEQGVTWLHLWKPYCPNETCTNIAQYESFEKRHRSKGLKLTFISTTYDMNDILQGVSSADFSLPVYVLQSSYYGVKNKKIRNKFHSELDPNYKEEDPIFYSDYLFVGDSLVYKGDKINDSVVESHSMNSIK